MIDIKFIIEQLPKAKATTDELFIAKGGYVIERGWRGVVRQIKNRVNLQRSK